MDRQSHGAPMEFEYQNGTGPVDTRSPFANVGANVQRWPTSATESTPFKRKHGLAKQDNQDLIYVHVGSHSAFESPSRPSHSQPRNAATQPSSPSKAKPPVPPFTALYATPRRQTTRFDDSSAGETPKSPDRDESDATPDIANSRTAMSMFDAATAPTISSPTRVMERPASPTRRRDSFFGRLKSKLYSPGRGEVPRGDLVHTKDNRVRKMKTRDGRHRSGKSRRHSVSSSASDDESHHKRSPRKSPRKASQQTDDRPREPGLMRNFFGFIASHPTVPHILSFYAQLAFNVFLLSACAYVMYSFWAAIQGDINNKALENAADAMAEITECANNYRINGCASETRAPALAQVCKNWKVCMERDPMSESRGKLTAHVFAEIFNSFMEPISYKAMIFTLLLIFGCFGISNFAFGVLREKTAQAQHFNPYPQWQAPPTPQHTFNGDGQWQGTPFHTAGLEPAPSGGYGQIEGRGSPVRRLVYS